MYHTTSIIPEPGDVHGLVHDVSGERLRVIGLGRPRNVTLHVPSRDVLDALQAALDAIRADMDVEAAAEPEAVAS